MKLDNIPNGKQSVNETLHIWNITWKSHVVCLRSFVSSIIKNIIKLSWKISTLWTSYGTGLYKPQNQSEVD